MIRRSASARARPLHVACWWGTLGRGSRIIGDTNQPGIWEINIVRSTRSLSRSKHPSLAARRSPLRRATRRLLTEPLEDRRVLATWVPMGPAPIINGQVENIAPDNQVIGAAQAVVAHPSDANTVYIGAVNGGVWKTTNATGTNPTWTPLTDDLASLSIGDLEMDPTDPQTLLGGIGRASAFCSSRWQSDGRHRHALTEVTRGRKLPIRC